MFSKVQLSPTSKLVLRALIDYWNHETGYCYPKQQTLADATGISRKSIVKAIKELKEMNLIETQKKKYHINYSLTEKLFSLLRCEETSLKECKNSTPSCNRRLQPYITNKTNKSSTSYLNIEKTKELLESYKNIQIASPLDDYECAVNWLNSLTENELKLAVIAQQAEKVKIKWRI